MSELTKEQREALEALVQFASVEIASEVERKLRVRTVAACLKCQEAEAAARAAREQAERERDENANDVMRLQGELAECRAELAKAERERDEAIRDADYQEQLAAQACGESDALRAKLLLVTEALKALDGSMPVCRKCGAGTDEDGAADHSPGCYVGVALAAADPDCRAIRRKYRVEGARVMELHVGNAEAQLMTPEQVVDARWPEDAKK